MAQKKKKQNKFKLYALIGLVIIASNFIYHVYRNPIQLWSYWPLNAKKNPAKLWQSYSDVFKSHEKTGVPASFLAALAQVESSGDPLASPDWRWSFSTDITEIYSPASTAFGIMQITKGTFDLWLSECEKTGHSCPHPSVATRLRVDDSVRLTAIIMSHSLKNLKAKKIKTNKKRELSFLAVHHLCGAEAAYRFASRGFNTDSMGRCGSHSVTRYVSDVLSHEKNFQVMASEAKSRIAEN